MNKDILNLFVDATRCGIGSDFDYCACGKLYYNSDQTKYLEEEHISIIEKTDNKADVEDMDSIMFEGKRYFIVCDCWKERANTIIKFILGHRLSIATFLNTVRDMEIEKANSMPTVTFSE